MLSIIPNLNIYCPNEKEMENRDDLELKKITYFYRMMHGYKRIGVLLGEKEEGRLKNIEKWPLIKAYALDGI